MTMTLKTVITCYNTDFAELVYVNKPKDRKFS